MSVSGAGREKGIAGEGEGEKGGGSERIKRRHQCGERERERGG